MSYIGNTTQNQNYVPAVDYFNGDGSTTAFTLSRPVASVAAVQAVISNVPQNPGSAFTVSGSTITFTSAPPSGTANIYVYYTSPNTQVVQPGQGTVGATQIDGNYALWNKSGSDINYTSGNVCVGTTTALATAANRGNVTVNGSSGSIVAMGVGGSTKGYLFQDSSTMYLVNAGGGSTNIEVNGAARLSIDSSGRVTMPYQTMVSCIDAGTNGTMVLGYYALGQSSPAINTGSNFNTTTRVFTAPVAGRYRFVATITSGDSQLHYITAVKNNTDMGSPFLCYTAYNTATMDYVVPLAANDTFAFGSRYNSGLYQATINIELLG